jgi:hypothetical protein
MTLLRNVIIKDWIELPVMLNTSRYWISLLGGLFGTDGSGVVTDSLGNIYVCGSYTNGVDSNVLLIKYDTAGNIVWQKIVANANGFGIAMDSTGNLYATGFTSAATGSWDAITMKFDSVGNVLWQKAIGGTSTDDAYGVAVDSTGNIYVVGDSDRSEMFINVLLVKYDTNGNLVWQRTLGGGGNDYGSGIAIDRLGNVYVVGDTDSAGGLNGNILIAKYNPAGTVTWQRTLSTAQWDAGIAITTDVSNNLYITGYMNDTGSGAGFFTAKYNTSGALQWSIATDAIGNVYAAGQVDAYGAGLNDFLIVKFDMFGTVLWQRVFGDVDDNYAHSITIDSAGDICITGFQGNGYGAAITIKLPADGSKTGVYGAYTYQPISVSIVNSTMVDAAAALTTSFPLLTQTTTTFAESNVSIPNTITQIP